MLEGTFRFDTEGQVVKDEGGFEVHSTNNVRVKVHVHESDVHLALYRICSVLHPTGWRMGTTDVLVDDVTFVGNALSDDLRGWARTVDLCGASDEETHTVVHRLLFAALAAMPAFRETVAEALPKWTQMLVELWEREGGPLVNVTLDWGGVWRSLSVRPMAKRPTLDDTRSFNVEELERCRAACLDAADMFADRISAKKEQS